MHQNGKGSRPRPADRQRYEDNYDRIFGPKAAAEETKSVLADRGVMESKDYQVNGAGMDVEWALDERFPGFVQVRHPGEELWTAMSARQLRKLQAILAAGGELI